MSILNRYGWSRWGAKAECLKNARVSRGKYECAHCGEQFGPKQVEVDHVEPRHDPYVGFVSVDVWIARTFVPLTKLQVLCKPCHVTKSAEEAGIRAETRKANK